MKTFNNFDGLLDLANLQAWIDLLQYVGSSTLIIFESLRRMIERNRA